MLKMSVDKRGTVGQGIKNTFQINNSKKIKIAHRMTRLLLKNFFKLIKSASKLKLTDFNILNSNFFE